MAKRISFVPGIVIGSIALAFMVTITVGWNIIFPFYFEAVFSDQDTLNSKIGFWVIMAVGDVLLLLVILALTFFLVGMIRRTLHIRRQLAFIDTITHELKTPLTSLSLSIDTFQRRKLDEDTRRSILKRMDQDIQRLTHFIQHVIETNRIEHGDRKLQRQPCNLVDTINSCVGRIRERYDLSAEAIQFDSEQTGFQVMADPVGLESVVLNVIDNAVKYSPDDVQVTCVISTDDDEHRFIVTDRGLGLSPREVRQVFDRFSRVSTHSNISGSGLGLFIVKQLCKRMGMEIEADSDGHGRGSTFTLHIPRKLEA